MYVCVGIRKFKAVGFQLLEVCLDTRSYRRRVRVTEVRPKTNGFDVRQDANNLTVIYISSISNVLRIFVS